jgi:hypothetical protein
VADLEDGAVGEQGLQRGQRLLERYLRLDPPAAQKVCGARAVADRDIGGLSGLD